MQTELSISEIDALRKLQRNLAGSSDDVRVTCILVLSMGNSPSFVSDCLEIDSCGVDLLDRIGSTYKKTTEVPCEADASGQEGFMQKLSSLLKEKDEATVVYYADGVHPTRNSRSTCAWTEKGEELPQPAVSGRERVNVNGLLNAYDVTDVIARDCDSVNAQSTRVLYEAALEVINTGFYRTKGGFRKAIRSFFDRIGGYKEELEKLLTLNFRSINSQNISV